MLSLSLGATGVMAALGFYRLRQNLVRGVFNQLAGLREAKATTIEGYFRVVSNHILTLSEDRMLIQAVEEFSAAFRKIDQGKVDGELRRRVEEYYRKDFLPELSRHVSQVQPLEYYLPAHPAEYYLQYHYLVNTQVPNGPKAEWDAAADGSEYGRVHRRYHRPLRRVVEKFNYEDMLLVDAETEQIVYSAEKKPDFATSIRAGPYRDTALARVIRRCLTRGADQVYLTDYEFYPPSRGAPALFAASPIFDRESLVGVGVFEISIRVLDRIVSGDRAWEREGLGRTGASAIIGHDYLLRTNSRPFLEDLPGYLELMRRIGVPENRLNTIQRFGTTALLQEVRLPAVQLGLEGKAGSMEQPVSEGPTLLVSYGPLRIPGLRWMIASKMDYEEALAPVNRAARRFLIWVSLVFLGTAAAALWLTRSLLRPVLRLADGAEQVAAGDLTVAVPVESGDELGHLTSRFNAMVANIREKTETIQQKNRENEALLLNILPQEIAERLKVGEDHIADHFADVTVLFADLVGFTSISGQIPPAELVDLLNGLFRAYDRIAEELGIEKIKTIGDCYMAVCGLPRARPDHAHRMAEMALRMLQVTREYGEARGQPLAVRIGLNSGPVVAGVIGARKFIYDLWGDTVNLASRMESQGLPGAVQVTRSLLDRLGEGYVLEPRGTVEVKGKGTLETWWLRGHAPDPGSQSGLEGKR